MRRLADFLKQRLPEMALLAVASAALFSTVMYGFHTTEAARASAALVALWPAVLTVALTCISYSPKTVAAGGAAYVVAAAVALGAYGLAFGVNPLADAYDNAALPFLLGYVVTSVAYLCTRRQPLCLAFAVAGGIACALVQFLYLNGLVAQAVVFLLAAGALCVYRAYRARTGVVAQGDVSALQAAATGAVIAAAALALACAVFYALIAPLNPPAAQLKLFTEEYALEEVHVSGSVSVEHKTNEDLKSSNAEDGQDTTSKASDDTEEKDVDSAASGSASSSKDGSAQSSGSTADGFGEPQGLVRYLLDPAWWLFAVIGAIALAVLLVAAKLALRRRRVGKIEALPADKRMVAYQLFFDRRMALAGRERPKALTLLEYARTHAADMAPFEEGAPNQASYLALAQSASASGYGMAQPSEQACQVPRDLYSVFYKNLRRLVGLPKYLLLFFRV